MEHTTAYESIERKVQILRDVAYKCLRKEKLEMAIMWSKKADTLKWNLNHLTIGEAECHV